MSRQKNYTRFKGAAQYYPIVTEASKKVANLTERKNMPADVSGVKIY
jgi:hypothetical protein